MVRAQVTYPTALAPRRYNNILDSSRTPSWKSRFCSYRGWEFVQCYIKLHSIRLLSPTDYPTNRLSHQPTAFDTYLLDIALNVTEKFGLMMENVSTDLLDSCVCVCGACVQRSVPGEVLPHMPA